MHDLPRYNLLRVLVGLLVAQMYLVVLLLARPYKHGIVNTIAFSAQLSIVSVFLCSALLKVYSPYLLFD